MAVRYRHIEEKDNQALAEIIKSTLESQGNALDGTVYTDEATNHLFDSFQGTGRAYFVAEENGILLGGSGIAEIKGENENYCELCRMFLSPQGRGRGIGAQLMSLCLDFAKESNYKYVYIETFGNMNDARKLYERSGFEYIDHRLGNTGHFSCDVTMLRAL